MKKLISLAMIAVLTGCASIISDSDYTVTINSAPEQAQFEIFNEDGLKIANGVTPNTLTLSASAGFFNAETYTIKMTKTGYQPKTYTMKAGFDGWYVGNILLGGLVGMLIVDPATGAMWTLPKRVDVSLDQQLAIVDINDITDEQREQLIKL